MTSIRLINRCVSFAWLLVTVAALGLLPGCSSIHDLPGDSSRPNPNPAATTRDSGFSSRPNPNPAAATSDEVAGRLRAGDGLSVRIDTGGATSTAPPASDLTVDEDGNISLSLVGPIKAAGLTPSELAERIQANYVPRYYVRCNATVLVAQRFFYLGGEVRNPGRFPWTDDTTLMKAINTASGFTDYANRQKVQLTRGGKVDVYNCEDLQRNPVKDPPIRPGDTITVPRSIF
jgi:protein involved in polysaccharide export with SLBB domain